MKDNESHPIRNSVLATVIGGIMLTFWPSFRELIVKILSWSGEKIQLIWVGLNSKYEIYVWILLLLFLFSIPTIIKIIFFFKKRGPEVEELYKSDSLFGADWHWIYVNRSIKNLWCICPECKCELVYSEIISDEFIYNNGRVDKTNFLCERCNMVRCSLKGDKQYALGVVEREIRRKIRSDEWKANETIGPSK